MLMLLDCTLLVVYPKRYKYIFLGKQKKHSSKSAFLLFTLSLLSHKSSISQCYCLTSTRGVILKLQHQKMKGTQRVVLYTLETYQERKSWIWARIDLHRDLIKTIQELKSDDELAKSCIRLSRTEVRNSLKELEDLARWFKKSGLKPDEPYNRRVKNNEGK